jgi:hypothetical protein
MPNTLGLDDDLDGVEIVDELGRVFDVTLSVEEAEAIMTVGDLYDLLLRKLSPGDGEGKCTTAMAFYRIRRALGSVGYGDDLRPASDLTFLEQGGIEPNWSKIAAQADLHLPATASTPTVGRIGLACIFLMPIMTFCFERTVSSAATGLALGVLMAFVVFGCDPGRLPANCRTLGELSRRAAIVNYGRLAGMGARHRASDTWENLLEMLSRWKLPKSEIGRDTYFLESQLRKRAKNR